MYKHLQKEIVCNLLGQRKTCEVTMFDMTSQINTWLQDAKPWLLNSS